LFLPTIYFNPINFHGGNILIQKSKNIIKVIRKQKGMTLDRLAKVTGLTKGYLSKIERASVLPPFSTLELIANAFDIDVVSMIEKNSSAHLHPDIDVMRRGERQEGDGVKTRENCSFTSLLHSYRGRYMSPILVTFEPGAEREFRHDSEEFVYVLRGSITLLYEGETFDLNTGDCFYLDSRKEHRFRNGKNGKTYLLSVSFNYRRY
jgi:transcriptional regulator with XRE-family HTH domain